MSNITIIKGKLLKESVEVKYIDRKIDGKGNCGGEYDMPPHKDLVDCFSKLKGHAALMGEFIQASDITNDEILEKFAVKGFTIQGGEDMDGVILSAQKTLNTGKILGFNTPIISFSDEAETAYQFSTELFGIIEDCKRELLLYLSGKHGENPQQEIEFPENGVTSNNEQPELGETNGATENQNGSTAKRGRKKKVVEETEAA